MNIKSFIDLKRARLGIRSLLSVLFEINKEYSTYNHRRRILYLKRCWATIYYSIFNDFKYTILNSRYGGG